MENIRLKAQKKEFLGYLLVEKIRLSPFKAYLLTILVGLIYTQIFSSQKDFILWFSYLFIYPSISAFFLWTSGSIFNLLENLDQKSIADILPEDWKFAYSFYSNYWRSVGVFIFSIIIGVFFYITRPSLLGWAQASVLRKIVGSIGAGVAAYMIGATAFCLGLNVWIIWKIFQAKKVNIEPFHPDKCSGLSPLSKYSLTTAYFIAMFGLLIGIAEYRFISQGLATQYWVMHLIVPFYVAISLVSFLGPLLAAHLKMKEYKFERLKRISEALQNELFLCESDYFQDSSRLDNKIQKLESLESMYKRLNALPTWPFDTEILRKYLLSNILPLTPPVFAFLRNLVINYF